MGGWGGRQRQVGQRVFPDQGASDAGAGVSPQETHFSRWGKICPSGGSGGSVAVKGCGHEHGSTVL